MTTVRRIPVYRKLPACASNRSRLQERALSIKTRKIELMRKMEKSEDFMVYNSSEDEEDEFSDFMSHQILNTSNNFVDYIRANQYGSKECRKYDSSFGTRHVLSHDMLKESSISLDADINKIFCSDWLSHRQVVFGTKCNKLMVCDVVTQSVDQIPCLVGNNEEFSGGETTGIHALNINPSRTMLATSGRNSSELAVYKLPTLDPGFIGQEAHEGQIYDITWLDDEFVASCSKDSKLALWKIPDSEKPYSEIPSISSMKPLAVKKCKGQKCRAFVFNKTLSELAVLSTNGYLHVWNAESFKQKITTKLPSNQEPICISVNDKGSLYAVGCRSYTLMIDTRCLQLIKKINTRYSGIRSTSFKDELLTIGSGVGIVMFWDLRTQKYLDSSINSSRTVNLKTNRSYALAQKIRHEKINKEVRNNIQLQEVKDRVMVDYGHIQQVGKNVDEDVHDPIGMNTTKQTPAIYTHCYDASGLRLFCAGGPLCNQLYGNYAAIWQ